MQAAVARNINKAGRKWRVYSAPVNYRTGGGFAPMNPLAVRAGELGGFSVHAREALAARIYAGGPGVMLCPDCCDDEALFIELEGYSLGGVSRGVKTRASTPAGRLINLGDLKVLSGFTDHKLLVPGGRDFEVVFRLTPVNMLIRDDGRVTSMDGEFRFRIGGPCLLDSNLRPIYPDLGEEPNIAGRLEQDGDAWVYTKTPGAGFVEPEGEWWIDSAILYADSSDGRVENNSYTSAAVARNASAGASVNTTEEYNHNSMAYFYYSARYWVHRSFFKFDLSGVSMGSLGEATLNIAAELSGEAGVVIQESTASWPLTTASFSQFTGGELGRKSSWNAVSGGGGVLAGWQAIEFNAAGLAYLAGVMGSGDAELCVRNYNDFDDGDCLDVAGGWNPVRAGAFYADSAAGYIPYLELTEPQEAELQASQYNAAGYNQSRFNEAFEEPDPAIDRAGFRLRAAVYEPFTGVLKAVYGDDIAYNPLQAASFEFVETGCGAFSVTFNAQPQDLAIQRGDRIDIHLFGSSRPWYSGRVNTLPGLSTSADKTVYKGHGFFEVLDQIRVTEAYTITPLEDVVSDLAGKYLAHTDIVFFPDSLPQVGYTVQDVGFDRESLKDVLSTLAELANNYVFGVDENREFFFRPREGRPGLQFTNKGSQWVGHHLDGFELSEKSDGVSNFIHVKIGSVDSTDGNFADFTTQDLDSVAFFGQRESVESAPELKSQADAEQWAEHALAENAWPTVAAKAKGLNLAPWVASKDDLIRAEGSMRISMPRAGLVGPYYEPLNGYYRHHDLGTVAVYGIYWAKRTLAPRMGGKLGRVSILARVVGDPGDFTLTVKRGAATVATATAALSPWFTWVDIDLDDCQVSATVAYDLIFSAASGDAANYVEINYCTEDSPYSGAYYTSANSGSSWTQNTGRGLCFRAYLVHKDAFVLAIKKAKYSVSTTGISADFELGALDQPLEDQMLSLLRSIKNAELLTQSNSKE